MMELVIAKNGMVVGISKKHVALVSPHEEGCSLLVQGEYIEVRESYDYVMNRLEENGNE